jgi:uncharacterized protein (DUF983 family)
MTVKYTYKCSSCEHTYIEQRAAEDPQFFTVCHDCSNGTYEQTSVEVISEIVERNPGIEEPVIIEITE